MMDTQATTTILTLPTEILAKIIFQALCSDTRAGRFLVAARLSPVCRRFRDIVVWHLYSRCCVKLLHYSTEPLLSYIAKFLGFGEDYQSGYEHALKRFGAFKAHGDSVRALNIRTDNKFFGSFDFPHFNPVDHESSSLINPFITAFPNLKTLTINDRIKPHLPGEYLLGSLICILTTATNLKTLNLHLRIEGREPERAKTFVDSQNSENQEQGPPTHAAKLHELNINLTVDQIYNRDSISGIWLLYALIPLLKPSLKTITAFSFNVPGCDGLLQTRRPRNGTLKEVLEWQRAQPGYQNPLNRKLLLPNLRSLTFSGLRGNQNTVMRYLDEESFGNVEEVEVIHAADMGTDVLASVITAHFPRLRILSIEGLDITPHFINWEFIRDIKREIYGIKTIVTHTKSSKTDIENDLGPEFLRTMRRLVHEQSESRSNIGWRVAFEF